VIFIRLALKSLQNRTFSSLLTALSIALSVSLLLAVERTKRASEEGFTQSISQTDLLVGARTGPLNLILYTVFNIGSASNNISWKSYEDIKSRPEIEWTIPYSLGDGHKGFRVIGTDENFYNHYHFRGNQSVQFESGKPALDIWDVVIGSDVEKKLNYKLGDSIIIAHGASHGKGILLHDDKPFHITGILKPTGTAIDQSLYISLYGMEAMHIDWQTGAPPTKEKALSPDTIHKEDIKIEDITAFFVRTKSRIQTLGLQRTLNDYSNEPLLAIIPGATLAELWHSLSPIETVLKIISWMVLGVGLASMLSSILAGLNERRREMAILRSLGAGPARLTVLLVFESTLLTLTGIFLGLGFELSGFFLLSGWLENEFGLYLTGPALTSSEFIYIAVIIFCGVLIGLIPAYRASKLALKDGLSVRI
jgi:putative ABC transport system permease protein